MIKQFLAGVRSRLDFIRWEFFTPITQQDFVTIQSKKIPVVLVAGIYASGCSLRPLKKFLEQHGYRVYLASGRRNFAAIPNLARSLTHQILKIPEPKVQVIAHSQGGITALAASANPRVNHKVRRVITLGSPLRGCLLGSLAFWEYNRKYLKYDSKVTQKIAKHSAAKKFVTLHAQRDGVVFPRRCTMLPQAQKNAEVPVSGHTSLILQPKAWQIILRELERV